MDVSGIQGRDWIDAEYDYPIEQWETLIDLAIDLKRGRERGEDQSRLLERKTLFLMFFNQSLRTRTSFEVGMRELGGHSTLLDTNGIYMPARRGYEIPYKTERICDVANVLARYGDALAIRMYGPAAQWVYGFANEYLKEFAEATEIPVISMEDDKFHPCQALADMMTIKENFGGFKKKKIVVSWAYSGSIEKPMAVPQSTVLSAAKMGMDVVLARPTGFELDPGVIAKAKRWTSDNGATFEETDDWREAFKNADVVYPKSYGSLEHFAQVDSNGNIGAPDTKAMAKLFNENRDWKCTSEVMSSTKSSCLYMHCLPADRGMEVADEVIDGPHSVIYDQAENRLHAQKAILLALLGSGE